MTSTQQLISVIIPAYNAEKYLSVALQSIFNQNYHPMEIIVVDDGSTDGTGKVAAGFGNRIVYLHQENKGPPAARNVGLENSNGSMIGFLDADDRWSENKIALQYDYLQNNPSIEIVLGLKQSIKNAARGKDLVEHEVVSDPVVNLSLGSGLYRKSVFDKVGFFNQELIYCDDWDWFMRAKDLDVEMEIIEKVTLYCLRHDKNLTNNTTMTNQYLLKMLANSIRRRRQVAKK